jgi:hypothetical protein
VALIANYDGLYLDPTVSDTYFDDRLFEKRYYSSASAIQRARSCD